MTVDPQPTRASQLQELLGDKGSVLNTSTIFVAGAGGAGGVAAQDTVGGATHAITSGAYIDSSGHLHAVLFDDVTTFIDGVPAGTVIEILSDVVVT